MLIDEAIASFPGFLETLSSVNTQVFDVQNVLAYLTTQSEPPWDAALAGKIVRPPGDFMWMEYRHDHPDGKPLPAAAMMSTVAPTPAMLVGAPDSYRDVPLSRSRFVMLANMYEGLRKTQQTVASLDMPLMVDSFAQWLAAFPEDPAALISGQIFAPMESSPTRGRPYGYVIVFMALDGDGRILQSPPEYVKQIRELDETMALGEFILRGEASEDPFWMMVPLVPPWVPEDDHFIWCQRIVRFCHGVWTTAMWACSLMQSGNVIVDTHRPSDVMQRARIRRKKPPFVAYKTLRVTRTFSE